MSSRRITRSASSNTPTENTVTTRTIQPGKPTKRTRPVAKKQSEGETEALLPNATPNSNTLPPTTTPSTPPAKRARKAPPETPTPAPIGIISAPSHPLRTRTSSFHALHRPADPHTTSATLLTPHGSRLTSYPSSSPSKPPLPPTTSSSLLPQPSTSTTHLLEEACAHLIKIEPRLAPVIAAHPCRLFSPEGLAEEIEPFTSLASSIIAQQVSGAAAASIKRKFIGLFLHPPPMTTTTTVPSSDPNSTQSTLGSTTFPTPALVAARDVFFLKQAGLSQRKAEYIHGLAEKFVSGELSAKTLVEASDEELVERLVQVRGLGRWSVEMFACFALKRMDVFSTGDLGVQRGMAALMGKDVGKLKAKGGKWKYMSEKDMLDYSAKFAPYRSLFMWYMWRIEDVNVNAIQDN